MRVCWSSFLAHYTRLYARAFFVLFCLFSERDDNGGGGGETNSVLPSCLSLYTVYVYVFMSLFVSARRRTDGRLAAAPLQQADAAIGVLDDEPEAGAGDGRSTGEGQELHRQDARAVPQLDRWGENYTTGVQTN